MPTVTLMLTLFTGGISTAHASSEPGLVGRCIVIDAGHGAPDSGARGVDGVHEKDITLPVAKRLGTLLSQAGAIVVYTRTTDDDLATEEDRAMKRRQNRDLRNRVRVARKHDADAFVSVHCNAVTSPSWSGATTLYQRENPEGERLAKLMQARFKTTLLPTNRSADDTSTFYLLRRIPKAAVISEIGFISNPSEGRELQTARYQEQVAYAMYLSLMDYFGESPKAEQPEDTP